MTISLIVLVPLVALAVVVLFPFVGCVGDDPYLQGREDEKKEQEAKHEQEKQDEAKKQDDERQKQKYENVVGTENDLVSYWRLSEGEIGSVEAKDSAPDMPKPGEYKNVPGGGVNRSVPGVLSLLVDPNDKAAEFDGVRGYVEVPHDVLINPPIEFSIEAWIKPTGLTTQPQVVVGSYETDSGGIVIKGFVIDVFTDAGGAPRIRARIGNGTGPTAIDASLEGGSEHDGWRHVVLTYSVAAKSLKLYINADNGTPDAQVPEPPPAPQTFPSFVANGSTPLRIAAGQTEQPAPSPAPAQFFKGRIDEVALYRVPLDGSQVKNHFLHGIAITP